MRPIRTAAAAALLLAALSACSGGSGDGGSVDDLLHLLPPRADSALYLDAATLYDDDDLRDLVREAESQWDDSYLEDALRIYLDDLSYVVIGAASGASVFLLGGLDSLDALRDELGDLDYGDQETHDIEAWVKSGELPEAFAFLPDDVVLVVEHEDAMEDILRRRERDSASMFGEVEELASALPSGFLVSIQRCSVGDCLYGYALTKAGSGEVEETFTYLFRSDDDEAIDTLYEELQNLAEKWYDDCSNAQADRSGRMVTFEATCATDDFPLPPLGLSPGGA